MQMEGIIPLPFTYAHFSLIRYTENRNRVYSLRTYNGERIGYLKFRSPIFLKDTVIYSGPDEIEALLIIRPQRMLPSHALCEIIDAMSSEPIGTIQKLAKKSSPTWVIKDAYRYTVAELHDPYRSLVYRLFSGERPGETYHYSNRGNLLGTLRPEPPPRQEKLAYRVKRKTRREQYYALDFSLDIFSALDRRLAVCAAILLIEVDGVPKIA